MHGTTMKIRVQHLRDRSGLCPWGQGQRKTSTDIWQTAKTTFNLEASHSFACYPNKICVALTLLPQDRDWSCSQNNVFQLFNVHGSVHHYNILICIQQDATLHSLFHLETALHVSGGTITHHQERKQLYLHHLVFVTPLLLSAAIIEELELVWVCCGWHMPPTAHSNQFQLFHDSGR